MAYSRTTWADYPSLTTPITAARLNNIEAFLAGMSTIQDAWTDYTPTWTATGGTPTIGNGTLAGRYVKVGKLVVLNIAVVMGSTTSIGTTTAWTFSLPFAAASSGLTQVLTVRVLDTLPTATAYVGHGAVASGGSTFAIRTHAATALVGYNSPFSFTVADSDSIHISGTYEAA